MVEYIEREEVKEMLFVAYDYAHISREMKGRLSEIALRNAESIDLEDYIPIKYVQDFCKDCADEGIGTVSTYMEDAGEAIIKSWLAVKDTDFGKKYNQR